VFIRVPPVWYSADKHRYQRGGNPDGHQSAYGGHAAFPDDRRARLRGGPGPQLGEKRSDLPRAIVAREEVPFDSPSLYPGQRPFDVSGDLFIIEALFTSCQSFLLSKVKMGF
jgi:hypothetical protein